MYGRSRSPAIRRGSQRRMVRQIHWQAENSPANWMEAHRGAQIDARCREAQERAIRIARGRWRQC